MLSIFNIKTYTIQKPWWYPCFDIYFLSKKPWLAVVLIKFILPKSFVWDLIFTFLLPLFHLGFYLLITFVQPWKKLGSMKVVRLVCENLRPYWGCLTRVQKQRWNQGQSWFRARRVDWSASFGYACFMFKKNNWWVYDCLKSYLLNYLKDEWLFQNSDAVNFISFWLAFSPKQRSSSTWKSIVIELLHGGPHEKHRAQGQVKGVKTPIYI